jgi:hypothetical protein
MRTDRQTDGQINMTKLVVAFRNFSTVPWSEVRATHKLKTQAFVCAPHVRITELPCLCPTCSDNRITLSVPHMFE